MNDQLVEEEDQEPSQDGRQLSSNIVSVSLFKLNETLTGFLPLPNTDLLSHPTHLQNLEPNEKIKVELIWRTDGSKKRLSAQSHYLDLRFRLFIGSSRP